MPTLVWFLVVATVISGLNVDAVHADDNGRFQVIVLGFSCAKQTNDHALRVDGRDDEVWIVARILPPGAENQLVIRTPTMGDVNGKVGRIQAGSGSPRGGIKSGDGFPPNPFESALNPVPENGWSETHRPELPFVLWQGDLVDGQSGLNIEFAIWEDDEGSADDWESFLEALGTEEAQQALKTIPMEADATKVDLSGLEGLLQEVYRRDGDRTIGAPKRLSVSFGKAKTIASNKSDTGVPGLYEIEFKDSEVPEYKNEGVYTLLLQVKQVQ